MNYKALDTKSLAQQITEQIQDAILNGSLRVNERLPTEPELADRFGVSRPTIREALKRLAAKKLIRSKRGPTGGTFINQPSQTELQDNLINQVTLMVSMDTFSLEDIAEARKELELSCCDLAISNATQENLNAMKQELRVQADASLTDADFCASDVRFHRAFVNSADNPVLSFLMSAVIEALQPATNLIIFRFRDRDETLTHHKAMLKALEAKQSTQLKEAVNSMMLSLKDQYAKAQVWRETRVQLTNTDGTEQTKEAHL